MGDAEIEEAVHATDVPREPQKTGGAVVVPQGLQPVQVSEVKVETDPLASQLELVYRLPALGKKMALVTTILFAWCIYFILPVNEHMHFDARTHTYDNVLASIKKYDSWLTLPRTGFSQFISSELTVIIAAYFAARRTREDKLALPARAIRMLVPYAAGLPFTSITARMQSIQYSFAIAGDDLGKYGIFANHSTTTNGSLHTRADRVNTTETILRRAFLPPRNQVRNCDISNAQRGNEYVNVAYDFMTSDWQRYVLSEGVNATKTYTISALAQSTSNSTLAESDVPLVHSLFTRAVYLYVDAVVATDANLGGANSAVLEQLKLDTISYAYTRTSAPKSVDELRQYIDGYFVDHTDWQNVLNVAVADVGIKYHTFNLSKNVQFASVSLDIPLLNSVWHRELTEQNDALVELNTVWPGAGNVTYEIDVANECGPRTCGIENRGLAPELKVIAFGDCSANGGLDCGSSTRNASMWLAGFGRRLVGDAFELLVNATTASLQKAVVRNPRESHRMTMGRLTFTPQDLSVKYDAECRAKSCDGLSFHYYDVAANNSKTLVVGMGNTSMIEFGSSFDLERNQARGRPLVTRYTTGKRVEYEILQPENFDVYVWPRPLGGSECSGRMERCILTTVLNSQVIEDPLQATYTAGFFFLFHNAQPILEDVLSNGATFLEFAGSDKWYGVSFLVPLVPGAFGLVFGLYYAVALYISFRKQRERIAGHASARIHDPNILVRALADRKGFPRAYIDLHVQLPGQGAQKIRLRDLQIQSIEFGPIPEKCRSSVRSLVIRADESAKKTDQ